MNDNPVNRAARDAHMYEILVCSKCHALSGALANDPHAWDNWVIRQFPNGPANLCPKCAGTGRK